MAKWLHEVNIQSEWTAAQNDEMRIRDLIPILKDRIISLPLDQSVKEEIEPRLEELDDLVASTPGDEDVDADEFDEIWNQIYEWADEHRIWIKTLL